MGNPKSAKDDSKNAPEKACATPSANDTVVSDDDSATAHKTPDLKASPSSTDNSSYSGSDDETVIESDQPLFLDAIPMAREPQQEQEQQHIGPNTSDPLVGCDVGVAEADHHDAVMADFLRDTFPSTRPPVNNVPAAAPAFEDALDPTEVDAFFSTEAEA